MNFLIQKVMMQASRGFPDNIFGNVFNLDGFKHDLSIWRAQFVTIVNSLEAYFAQ